MTRKPCRNCKYAYEYKGRRTEDDFNALCSICDKNKKHKEYLQSKRKFTEGEPITTLDELLKQEFVMWGRCIRNIAIIKILQLSLILRLFESGELRKAVRKERED